jgi:hypothetical protein
MAIRRGTDNTMAIRRGTDNTMAIRRGTKMLQLKPRLTEVCKV